MLALAKDTAWLLSFIVPPAVITAITVPLIWWQWGRTQKRKARRDASGVDPREASMDLTLPVPPDQALLLVERAFSHLRRKYGTDVKVDLDKNQVCCQTGLTFRSVGQMVVADVAGSNGGSTIHCRSWPVMGIAITDWGEGKRLLGLVAQGLQRATVDHR